MGNWTTKAKKIAAGKWIRFDAQTPQYILQFIGEPTVVEKVSQMGPSKGEKYSQMSFPVLLDNEEKILEPNRSLLTQLIAEDEEESIIGAELSIKCLNPEKKTQWRIRRLAGETSDIQTWKGAKKAEPEEEEEVELVEDKTTQDSKDKEKFMEGVKKTKARKLKKEEKPTETEAADIDNGSAEKTA